MVLSFPSRTKKKKIAVKSGLLKLNEMCGASLYNGKPELLTDWLSEMHSVLNSDDNEEL